jgi:hypothetical protein
MITNLNGMKSFLERFAQEIAVQEKTTGRSAEELLADEKIRQEFTNKLLTNKTNQARITTLLKSEAMQALQVPVKGGEDGQTVSYSEVVSEKMEQIDQLMKQLPALIQQYDESIEQIKTTEAQGVKAKEKYAKQLDLLKQVATQQLSQVMRIKE